MKALFLTALLLVSCGKKTVVETVIQKELVQPDVEDTRLQCQVFDLTGVAGIPVFKNLTNIGVIAVSEIDSPSNGSNVDFRLFENTEFNTLTENFGLNCNGFFEATESGSYTFIINSDDGSTLSLGDTKIIDNNGDHGMVRKTATVLLMKGTYKFNTSYYNHSGLKGFTLSYKRPRSSLEEVLQF